MSIDSILLRLDKPKRTGSGTWIAKCPAHNDRSPSLTLRETEDGRILLKCHAECSTQAVLDAIGIFWSDLFPKALGEHLKPIRKPFPAADVLEAVMQDALAVQQVAHSVAKQATVSPEQLTLLNRATARILAARDLVNG